MNIKNITPSAKKRIKVVAILITASAVLGYLHRHGISPVWAAVAIVAFPGFFRFIYRMACLIVSLAILAGVLSFLIF